MLALAICATSRADAPAASVFDHAATPEQLQALLGPSAGALKSAAVLRGEFTQSKFLKELPKPLRSSGEFLVARGLGVDWHTEKPFNAAVLLTPQAMIQRAADGSTQRVSADQQPGLRAVGQVFDALFTLNLERLAETFMLYGEAGDKGSWTLGLVPREAAFAKLMQRIVITGAAEPAQIVLYERSGDRTEIAFSGVRTRATLSDAERNRFTP